MNNTCKPDQKSILPPLPVPKERRHFSRVAAWIAAVSCIVVVAMILFAIISCIVYRCKYDRNGPHYDKLPGEEDTSDLPITWIRNLNLGGLPITPLSNQKSKREKLLNDSSSDAEI